MCAIAKSNRLQRVKCFKEVKTDKWQALPYSYSLTPIDWCVRINHKVWQFIQWRFSVIDILIVTVWISKLVYSWLFIDPSEHHHTAQTSSSTTFLNCTSTMLNNIFKGHLNQVCLKGRFSSGWDGASAIWLFSRDRRELIIRLDKVYYFTRGSKVSLQKNWPRNCKNIKKHTSE